LYAPRDKLYVKDFALFYFFWIWIRRWL